MLTATILTDAERLLAEIAEEPFLTALAENRLPDAALGCWVREDTHFLWSLRRMIARLIADAPTEAAVDLMAAAYPALQSELDRFAEEAARLGEDLGSGPGEVTRRFCALLHDAARGGFAEGIGAYWAAEVAYLDAWSAVRRRVGAQGPHAAWIENWTSEDFRAFVDALAAQVDVHGDPEAVRRRAFEVFALERELWRWCFEAAPRDS